RAARLVQTYRLVRQQVEHEQGLIPIRSDFVRVINRRYQPLHMWPTFVSAKALPGREAGSAQDVAESDDADESSENDADTDTNTNYGRRWFKGRSPDSDDACPLVGRDISSSQTQIVATLLGLEELEALTTSRNNEVSFKKWLADLAFKHHLDGPEEIKK